MIKIWISKTGEKTMSKKRLNPNFREHENTKIKKQWLRSDIWDVSKNGDRQMENFDTYQEEMFYPVNT